MRVVGVNGIATNGERNIDLLLNELTNRGIPVMDVGLPLRHWFSARWGGCRDGQLVARASDPGDVVVAHSFGCLRAWHAHRVRQYKAIVCIAPAMSEDIEWDYPERVHCFYSKKDLAIKIGARLLLHPFGVAGTKGFTQPGTHNHEYRAGHNDYFIQPLLGEIADYITDLVLESNSGD